MKSCKIALLSLILPAVLFVAHSAQAIEQDNLYLHLDAATIEKGYTAEINQQVHPTWGDFRVGIVPDLVNEPVYVNLKKFDGSFKLCIACCIFVFHRYVGS